MPPQCNSGNRHLFVLLTALKSYTSKCNRNISLQKQRGYSGESTDSAVSRYLFTEDVNTIKTADSLVDNSG